MIENADAYIESFAKAGADWITIHVESCVHLHRSIARIRELGKKAGVVLNPATPVSSIDAILEDVEVIMLMSVNPGFGGQSFIPSTLEKIRRVRELLTSRGVHADIEIDGGIDRHTIGGAAQAGANVFVAG
ncbi:MAG: ribulose-phosphate 3-epimerase, partial [Desulfopila sp.]